MKRLRFAGRSPRIAYVVAAVLLRSMDAGATVAVVLVAVHTSEVGNPVRLGALVGATLTLPHVLAPWTARLLDVRPDPRQVIALSGLWFGALLAVLVLGLGHVAPGLLLLDASAAGLVGPILTGGLSSQVSGAVGADRSATSVDALTYGLSLTLAPAMLATSATVVGARPAAWL